MLSSRLEKNLMGVVELKMSDLPRQADLARVLLRGCFVFEALLVWTAFLSFAEILIAGCFEVRLARPPISVVLSIEFWFDAVRDGLRGFGFDNAFYCLSYCWKFFAVFWSALVSLDLALTLSKCYVYDYSISTFKLLICAPNWNSNFLSYFSPSFSSMIFPATSAACSANNDQTLIILTDSTVALAYIRTPPILFTLRHFQQPVWILTFNW